MKKGIYTWFGFEIPARERLEAIREAGFSAVMLNWEDGLPEMRQAGVGLVFVEGHGLHGLAVHLQVQGNFQAPAGGAAFGLRCACVSSRLVVFPAWRIGFRCRSS